MNLHFVGYLIGMSEKGDETLSKMDELISIQYDRVDRLKKELVNFNKDGADRKTKHHHQIRLDRIQNMRYDFDQTHKQIIQFVESSDDDYVKKEIFDEFENKYLDTMARIKESYDKFFPPSSTSNVTVPAQASDTNGAPPNITYQIMRPTETAYKLPTLTLQQFDGDYTEWLSFYDSFLQIHHNEHLTNQHKFQYLKGALSPSVKSVIGYLEITAENYEAAWNELKKRYYNKRVLFKHYMEKFMSQPIIFNETADELRTLHDVSLIA